SRDTFCPIGPYIVTADEVADPQNLDVRLWNNGELMQDFNTSKMVSSIPECLEFLSSVHTLEPGNVVSTGTDHRGLHPLMDGDHGAWSLTSQYSRRLETDVEARDPTRAGGAGIRAHRHYPTADWEVRVGSMMVVVGTRRRVQLVRRPARRASPRRCGTFHIG